MSKRLRAAFLAYGILAILAGWTLEGKLRVFLWILLAGLALKTWIASRRAP